MSKREREDAMLHAFAHRSACGGASTLDMLKHIDVKPQSARVRNEMLQQASAAMRVPQNSHNDQLLQNTTTLGERLGQPNERIVPGTPVVRQLQCGRLVRTDGKDDALYASRSEPALPHPRRALHNKLHSEALAANTSVNSNSARVKDALDIALSVTASTSSTKQPQEPQSTTSELGDDARLTQHRNKLEQELLHVTKKLNRKYTKQLFPTHTLPPSKIHTLAAKWNDSEHAPSEHERYTMYMDSRFSTQAQLDYYERSLEPRDVASNRHKHNTAHTKYGDALAKSRDSLRGKF